MKESTVYVYRTSPVTLDDDIEKVLDTPDFQEFNSDKETLIKINANYDRDWPGCNTSRWFLDSLLKNLREKEFNDLKVIEGDLKLQPALRTLKVIGIDKVLEKYNVPFLPIENLPRDNELPVILKNTQLISTSVLHTHTFAVISCAAKNLYGLLPIYREKYHEILSEKILELVKMVKVFTIVDGTVGLEGGSMRLGNPRRTNLILAGWDPICVDVIASKIMGFSNEQIPYLNMAAKRGLINSVSVKGDFSIDNLPNYNFMWERPKLSYINHFLRETKITRGFFEYNSFFDLTQNRLRRLYTTCVYYKKKNQVFSGDWSEYEKRFVFNNENSTVQMKGDEE